MSKLKDTSACLEAHRLVYCERGKQHGDLRDNFERAVKIFNAWRDKSLTAEDGVCFMQCLKMSRERSNPDNRDHRVDQVGYIECRELLMNSVGKIPARSHK